MTMDELTPRRIVEELDRYIIGQQEAKRAVAVALRNRHRRQLLAPELRDEVTPKNILMMGPTGVGKTEIARRLARLVEAPFIKVEATKFTEVGYVGRDVDSIIRDLVETAVRMVRQERTEKVKDQVAPVVEERLVELLAPLPRRDRASNPLAALFGMASPRGQQEESETDGQAAEVQARRAELRRKLRAGELEDQVVEVETEESRPPMVEVFSGQGVEEMGINLQDLFGQWLPRRRRRRKVTVAEARRILTVEEAQKLIDQEEVTAEAIRRAEQTGIVFLDEIDKIAGRERGTGPDVSREGVQRDILPIVEGSTVMTKYGPVRTDHILFIAAGAFHVSKPSDLIPELQGRFPIRVELKPLGREELRRILVEPRNALTRQYKELLATEGVELEFTEDGIDEIARLAERVNEQTENIGARRLQTLMERVLEEISFDAESYRGQRVVVDAAYVRRRLADVVEDRDLSRYIL
ncbi:ATP-dependent protease ATPase subunit HslU [Carboxydochorda subterranea]|uniref:ATP-dependent protease ATPase subunit HslU n=2 Tax=Carboxydichorda subterranea TaxID=3109565 RepID=A0ABZ1C2G3_9FIRM|nr:ATP-dependent protease ATPase subunit HslU [Limnochorda sp. L945t]WRP18442.1 ATP-dependent protease ATPase subunit HslU [Limnochorda sp. L945t]